MNYRQLFLLQNVNLESNYLLKRVCLSLKLSPCKLTRKFHHACPSSSKVLKYFRITGCLINFGKQPANDHHLWGHCGARLKHTQSDLIDRFKNANLKSVNEENLKKFFSELENHGNIRQWLKDKFEKDKRAAVCPTTTKSEEEKLENDFEYSFDLEDSSSENFRQYDRGDLLVFYRGSEGIELAACTGTNVWNYSNVLTSINENGTIKEFRTSRVLLRCPNVFKKLKEVQQPLSDVSVPSDVLPFTIKLLKKISQRAQDLSRSHRNEFLRILTEFNIPNKLDNSASFSDLLKFVYKTSKPSPYAKISLLHFLLTESKHFLISDHIFSEIQKVYFLPSSQNDSFDDVVACLRQKSTPYLSFIKKARHLIQVSRDKYKLPISTEEIKPVVYSQVTWTEFEKKLLRYLVQEMIAKSIQSLPNTHLCQVYKEVGLQTHERGLTSDQFAKFLTDIGVWASWQPPRLFQQEYSIAGLGTNPQLDAVYERECNHFKKFVKSEVKDSLESQRVDLRHLKAFAFDSSSTKEIDDAISVEELGMSNSWLHIHVANPTSTVDIRSPLGTFAERNFQTIYHPNKIVYMLPLNITQKYWSLDSSSTAQRALTFSAKISKNGDILDYKVRPSFISSVIKYTPQQLDKALHSNRSIAKDIVSGPVDEETKGVSNDHMKDILRIYELSKQACFSRLQKFAFVIAQPTPTVELLPNNVPYNLGDLNHPVYWSSFPTISLNVSEGYSLAESVISECMILAGRVSSLFFQEHKLPGIFRGQPYPIMDGVRRKAFETLLSNRSSWGLVETKYSLSVMPLFESSHLASTPVSHFSLGLKDGYIQSTSPLRRFTDFFTHHQIQSVLLKAPKNTIPDGILREKLNLYNQKEKSIKTIGRYINRFWALKYIERLPKVQKNIYHGYLMVSELSTPQVMLEELGVKAHIDILPDEAFRLANTRQAFTIKDVFPESNILLVALAT